MCINVRFVRPSKTIRSIFYWTFWRKYKLPLRNPLRVRYTSENLLGVFILTDARITKLQSPSAPNVPVRMKNTLIIYDRLAVASRQRVWSCCLHFSSFWCWTVILKIPWYWLPPHLFTKGEECSVVSLQVYCSQDFRICCLSRNSKWHEEYFSEI